MTPPIAIIGAGPAGLFLARMLEIKKFDYIVYEKGGPENDPMLHGVSDIHPDTAQAALKGAGLWDAFQKRARMEPQLTSFFDHHGEILTTTEIDLPRIDWLDLRAMLVESIPSERVRWQAGVESVQRHCDGSIEIVFADGSVEKDFKLVVGADGVWSKVRHLVSHSISLKSTCKLLDRLRSHPPNQNTSAQATYEPPSPARATGGQRLGARSINKMLLSSVQINN